jgi:hypothetical protein
MSLQEQDYWQGNVHVAKQVDIVRVRYVMNDKGSRYEFLVLVALVLVALVLMALVLMTLVLMTLVLVALVLMALVLMALVLMTLVLMPLVLMTLVLVRFLASLDCSVLTAGIQMIAVVLSR